MCGPCRYMTLHARRQQTCLLNTHVLEIVVEIQDRVMRCNLTRTPTPRMHLPIQTHKHLGKQAIFRAVFIKLVVKGGTYKYVKCRTRNSKSWTNARAVPHCITGQLTEQWTGFWGQRATTDGFLGSPTTQPRRLSTEKIFQPIKKLKTRHRWYTLWYTQQNER